MNELLTLLNQALSFIFNVIGSFLGAYIFLILVFVTIATVVSIIFYIASMARTHHNERQ